jgi:ABC-type dipeptide/oligopeptide/nickel transport system permease component
MISFLVRRLLLLIPVLMGILIITFALARLIPGDPCTIALGEKATPEVCNQYLERMGLNDSLPTQFLRYLTSLAHGDLGNSIRTNQTVSSIVLLRLPMTLELAFCAMLFATLVGIPLGIIAALRRNSTADVSTMMLANVGVSMPVFFLGLLLAYLFAIVLKGTPFWLPPSARLTAGLSTTPLVETFHLENLQGLPLVLVTFLSNMVTINSLVSGNWKIFQDATRHLILPAITVGTIPLAIIARMTRSSLLDVLGLDYVRTARAKGLKERMVVFRHAFRNALLPIITIVGLQLGGLLGGAILTETIFGLPGMGTIMVQSIYARDYPVLQAAVVLIALIFVIVNLAVDISYAYLDPRIRLQ